VVTGPSRVQEAAGRGRAGRQCGTFAARHREGRCGSAEWCWRSRSRSAPHTKFKGEIYVLSKEEGGRHTPFFNGYRPQFLLPDDRCDGYGEASGGHGEVMPGDNISLEIELHTPVAMEKGLRFRHPRTRQNRRRGNHYGDTEVGLGRPGQRASRRDITEWVGSASCQRARKKKQNGWTENSKSG